MKTLALDLAGKTGYAIRYDTGHVKLGVWNLARGQLERRSPLPMFRLWRRLCRLAEDHDIERVIYEDAFGRGAALYRLDTLMAATNLFCFQRDIPWMRVTSVVWKKALLSKGNARKDEYHRAAIERWPELSFPTDDHAAARWLLEYAEQ